jgi:hypothetical protein
VLLTPGFNEGSAVCRNIRTLHNFEPPATAEEIHAASLQFVRKISGATRPSRANEAAFNKAVTDVEAARARDRAARRFGQTARKARETG